MTKGTIQNREAFLNNIAESLGRKRRTEGVTRPDPQHQPQLKVFADLSADELMNEFKAACEKIHTKVLETEAASLADALTGQVDALGGGPVVTAEDPRFLGFGLGEFLERDDVHVWDLSRGKENIAIAEKANVGVTFSDITLAESGTVVLFNDEAKARAVSLLPTAYIAIIPKSSIVPRMAQAARAIDEKIEAGETVASCVNFISGPSNSADIEYNLVVGVHGPVQASYIVVMDR